MKISEKRLCQIIKEESRRALFEKDEERIKVKIIKRANTVTNTGGAGEIQNYKIRDANPENVKSEKELKRIWAEEVIEEKSRNFFDGELIKVHFINSLFFSGKSRSDTPGFVLNHRDKFKQAVEFIVNNSSKSRDELSCLGYLPGDVLKGDVKDKSGEIGNKQISEAGYNNFYHQKDDLNLYQFCHKINEIGSSFMISGVLEHGGQTTWILDKLISDGFTFKELNCNYEKINKSGNDKNTIFVYNSSFEKSRISELSEKFSDLAIFMIHHKKEVGA